MNGPSAVIVEDRLFKESIVEYVDHFAVAADPGNAQRCPNVFPGDQLHGFTMASQWRVVGNVFAARLTLVDETFGAEKLNEAHGKTAWYLCGAKNAIKVP